MTTSETQGRKPRNKPLPSYMKPTATSRLKENLYSVDYKMIRSKSRECPSPEPHELDYIPPPAPPPGVPSFMRPTKTWGGKVSDKASDRKRAGSRLRRRASCAADFTSTAHMANASVLIEPDTPSPSQHGPNSPTSPLSGHSSAESTGTKKPRNLPTYPPVQRRRSSYLAPRPSIISTFEESSFTQSRCTPFAEAIRQSLINTAPAGEIKHEIEKNDSSGNSSTAVGPSTPTSRPARRKRIPRYMMPTAASSARVKD